MKENITFQMNLVSHLAAADCAPGVAGNIDIIKHTCTIIYHQQDTHNLHVMSPESYEKIWKENFLLSGIHSLV